MKFLYEYRTSDNAKHPGVICATDRDAAYAELKRQGIKPCRFAEAPGFFNKLFGKGKRWIAIGVLGAGCVVLGVLFISEQPAEDPAILNTIDDTTRRQLIGDAAVIEKGINTGWAEVFELEGERFLASFAIPGVAPSVTKTTEVEIKRALAHTVDPQSAASIEARQIIAMVEGMKREVGDYLADGGTFAKYLRRIMRRQQTEIAYYDRAKHEVESAAQQKKSMAEVESLWEKRNANLRKMGIKLISLPAQKK